MGVVAYYYVVEDEIINKVLKSDFDIDEYLSNELMDHEYKGSHFEKRGILFWQGVKTWSPMYELLKVFDKSDNQVLSKIHSEQYHIAETEKNDRMYYYQSSVVKEIWTELRNISIGEIENSIDNLEIVEKISSIQGYWNERIERKVHVVMEFFELYKAFYEAQLRGKGIITSFG
jgi:Domain of unknown function (DUF1877)